MLRPQRKGPGDCSTDFLEDDAESNAVLVDMKLHTVRQLAKLSYDLSKVCCWEREFGRVADERVVYIISSRRRESNLKAGTRFSYDIR